MGIDTARLDAFAAVTIGNGLRRPGGDLFNISEAPLEMLRVMLETHDGAEAWWSPGIFADARRSNDRWRAQFVMVVDVDFEDAMGQHVAPDVPLDIAGAPCTHAHATPRGARLIFLLDQPIVDRAAYPRAWAAIVERAQAWLTQPGFVVDKQCKDLARFYWTPRAHVEGVARSAELVTGTVAITELAPLLRPIAPVLQLFARPASNAVARARAWLQKAEPAIGGEHGSPLAFRVVERAVRGFDLSDADALDALSEWNTRCVPPWSTAPNAPASDSLVRLIQRARELGDTPVRSLLEAEPAPREVRVEYIQDRGQAAPIDENVARMLGRDPAWRGGPKHDRYSLLTLWPDPLPELIRGHVRRDREIVKTDYSVIQAYAIREHQIRASREVVEHGTRLAAERNAFDSLASWIDALPKHDGTPRLDRWLSTYLGCEDTPFHHVTGRAWLRAAVARAREPGLHVDLVPVLQGEQGTAKNRAISALFAGGPGGAPWLARLGVWRPDHPDTKRLACSRWILHDDEFSARDPKQVDALKSWISAQEEQWIAKYSNDVTVMRRRALLVCSVNPRVFLQDPTGHRRWVVWRVGTIDWTAIERDRLQLLAEASTGDWREGLDSVVRAQHEAAEDAAAEDGLESHLLALTIEGKWTADGLAGNILSGLIGVPPERQDKAWSTRLGLSVHKVGGHVVRKTVGHSEKIRVYYPPVSGKS